MTEPFEQDEVPSALAGRYPDVGHPPPSADDEDAGGLQALHAVLDAEGPLDRARSLSTPTRGVLAASLVLGLAGLVMASTRRPDLGVYPPGRLALDLSLMLGPLLLALLGALRPLSKPALPWTRRAQTVGLGVLGLCVLLTLPAAHELHPASVAGEGALFWKQVGACFGFGTASALLATVGLGMLSRNGARRWVPGSLGVWAAGLAGLLALYLHCPVTALAHLWAGHATIVVPVLAVAWLLGGRVEG